MSDVPNDWWIPQDEDESWQQQLMQDEAFAKLMQPKPVSSKDEFKKLILDISMSSIDKNVKLF
jgi:hypothetical protein